MPDILVKVYLWLVIVVSFLFAVSFAVLWLKGPRGETGSAIRVKLFWRNLFVLMSGLACWYCFTSRLVNTWVIMIGGWVLFVISVYAAEFIERWQVKKICSNRAA